MHRPRRTTTALLALATLGAIAALAASMHASAMSPNAQLNVRQTTLGRILVDIHGRTLYLFRADKGTRSVCYGQCAKFWPPLLATKAPKTGAGLKASLFGTTLRKGGVRQVTYNGHPLYRFVEDTKAGQTTGQGVNHFGGLWWVLSPAGTAIVKKSAGAPPPQPAPTTTSGYHYP